MTLRPLIKWAGGKSCLLTDLIPRVPNYYTYYEPFIGGGALFLASEPQHAVINDYNPELVNLYNVVKNDPEELIALLEQHRVNHSSDYYYEVRGQDRLDRFGNLPNVVRASRFLYLDKTCFNGLWRVNANGFNNVPIGRYAHPNICPADNIRAVSEYLNRADVTILQGDFAKACAGAREGDFVYLDPPYDATFVDYTDSGFDKEEQQRLARLFRTLSDAGVKCMLSNSDTPFIRELYSDFTIEIVQCFRAINSKAEGRGKVNEVVVTNYAYQSRQGLANHL